ncbi:predicted alpha/beta superfamily hydrolase [Lachnospiraceae bacterium KM106-2]|nr:predicted alpha/beta superfamily hydrolase [Lachnospiraceae bacterium KM106-2]
MKLFFYGDKKKESILLIPPGGLDERCFSHVLPFLQDEYIIIAVLNGSVLNENSTLINRRIEASNIIDMLAARSINEIKVMSGISYGASVALEVLMMRKLKINRTVLDGGAFARYGWLMRTCNFVGTTLLVRGIKRNPEKSTMYASLGKEIDEASRDIFIQMSKESLKNLIQDSMNGTIMPKGAIQAEDHLVITYGSKDGYRDGIKSLKKAGYPFKSMIIAHYGHCQYFALNPEKYAELLLGKDH